MHTHHRARYAVTAITGPEYDNGVHLAHAAQYTSRNVDQTEREIGCDEHANLIQGGSAHFPVLCCDCTLELAKRGEVDVQKNHAHDNADRGHDDDVFGHGSHLTDHHESAPENQHNRSPHPREETPEDTGPQSQALRRLEHLDG